MRYAIVLRQEGISVSFCAQRKLHSLIKSSGIDQSPLTPEQATQVADGYWIPLLSLPRHLEVSPSHPIITETYIKTTEALHTKWAKILSAEQLPIIGINWQGNPKTETTGLRGRSLELETFAPVADNRQISLLSLQKGFGSEQLEACSFKDHFVSCQDQVNETWDFLETAAIVANCDLVITSDTSVAHLVGGMGKTTWLLLQKVPDWRWGLDGETTFWYPSMRLFRQRERGNWDEVMERVAEALQQYFGNGSVSTQPAPAPQPAIKPKPIQDILAPISLGELIDKISILQIKTQHLKGTALENVKKELEALETTLNDLQLNIDATHVQRLKEVNQDLWQIEDDIRDQERQSSFGNIFIHLARSVYQKNDVRAAIKKEINATYGSIFVEEKSYTTNEKIQQESIGSIVDAGSNKLVKARDGYMIVNANDAYIGQSIIKYGEFSESELSLFSQIVRDKDNVIEVGANYGSHTLRLCQLANKGMVFAIEPQRAIFQALCGNIAINSIFNCHCIQKACSDIGNQPITVPEADFNVPGNFGGISMIEATSSTASETTVTLDTLFPSLRSLRLLKVDAEGMEKKILVGGRNLIKRTRPVLFIENDRIEKSEALIKEINDQGYRAFWHISRMFNPANFNGVAENVFGNIHSFNMVCFPVELHLNIVGSEEILDPSFHPLSKKVR